MKTTFAYDREALTLDVPDDAQVYESHFPDPEASAHELVGRSLREPIEALPLAEAMGRRRDGPTVIVISDITRPIPYFDFLPGVLEQVEAAGVPRDDIIILVATGMHRPSTRAERVEMLGESVADTYRIIDHVADDPDAIVEVPGTTWSGNAILLNRHLVEAGFRMVTGLVEPHFMAGFSGGRKAVCPGCSSLDTVRNFHGEPFLADPRACNGRLRGNPLHLESLSVAQALGVDYSLNVVLNDDRQVVRAFSGDLVAAHEAACEFVARCACPVVGSEADLVVTSSGGYPLDATFYQCVKGFVSCLPAVKPGGSIVAFGGCSEGIGSAEYAATMEKFGGGNWRRFLEHIGREGVFVKDQWQFQMHCRTLEKIGEENLRFVTAGLDAEQLNPLSVNPFAVPREAVRETVQAQLDAAVEKGHTIAVFPEGPYCAPVSGGSSSE